MKRFALNSLAVMIIFAASAGLALLSLDPLIGMGVFGTCFEGACGYAAFFGGFPVITIVLTAVGCAAWFGWRRGRVS